MATPSREEESLINEFRRTNIRFRDLSEKTKELADKSLASTVSTVKLQEQTSAASQAMQGISSIAGPVKNAIQSAAKNSLFMGSTLETATGTVKVASKEYDKKTQDIKRLRRGLGVEANTISGINQLENARKAAVQARVELFDKEIAQIDAALASQAQVIERRQQELDASERSLALTQTSIITEQALIDGKTTLIESIQDSIIAQQQKLDADNEALDIERQVKKLNEDQLAALQRQQSVQQGLIDAKQAEIDAVDAVIAQERARELQLQSELSQNAAKKAAIQAEIGAAVNYQQRSALESLHRKALEDLAQEESSLTQRLTDAQDSIAREVSARIDLADELRSQQTALADTTSEISRTQADIAASNAEINRLTAEISAGVGNMELLRAQLEAEENARRDGMSRLAELKKEEKDLIKTIQDNKDALAEETSTLQELTELRQTKIDDEAAEKQNDLNEAIDAKQAQLTAFTNILGKVAGNLNKLVAPILELQKQLGISAGSAAKLKFENLVASAKSYANSLATGAPGVSAQEIETTQGAFQQEFGGVLTSDAAAEMAKEAKRLGVGAGEMAKARRVFMTSTMGNVEQAKAQTDKFIGEFAKKGLTAKDAMAAIGQNSELLARNGTRFATSFARAAADAKKIGVDLSKVDQIGDSIIGDFEGFLEKTSELGAMGFNLDTTRLSEIAESGDTGALFNELRSQLASTGKDITKLRRSEQLALSQAFGISMEELQRMAAPKGKDGSGAATLSPEQLQKDANKSLGDLVFRAETIIRILGIISAAVVAINARSLIRAGMTGLSGLGRLFGRGGAGGSSIPGTPGTTPTPGGPMGGGGPGASFLSRLNPAKMLAAAASLAIIAGALWIFAKAVQEFGKADWTSFGKALIALAALAATAMVLDKAKSQIIQGSIAMVIMGAALFVIGKAVQQFANVNWEQLSIAGVALIGLGAATAALGLGASLIMSGSLALLLMGAALWVFGKAMQQFTGISWKTVGVATSLIVALGLATAGLGLISPLIAIGAGALVIMAGALFVLGKAIEAAAPGLEKLRTIIATAFEGIASVVTAAGDALTKMFTQLKEMSAGQLLALGAAMPALAAGLGLLATALVVFPTFELGRVAGKFEKFGAANAAGKGIREVAAALKELDSVIDGIDADKLTKIIDATRPSFTQMLMSAGSAVGGAIRGVASRVANFFAGSKEEEPNTNKLNKVSEKITNFDSSKVAAANVNLLATALNELAKAIQVVDVNKLTQVTNATKPSVGQMVRGAVSKIAGFLGLGTEKTQAPTTTTPAPITPPATAGVVASVGQTNAAMMGANTPKTEMVAQTPTVKIDLSSLERKLDRVIAAIGSMTVEMDGNKVGKVLVANSDAATTAGILRS